MRKTLWGSFPFLLLCAITASAQSAGATGTWDASMTSPQGPFNVKLILKQEGEKVTGVVRGQRGDTPVEGTNNGKEITLKYTVKFQDNDLPITLTGVFDAASIKGSADYGGMAQGEFNAKRAADTSAAPAKPPATSAPAKIRPISAASGPFKSNQPPARVHRPSPLSRTAKSSPVSTREHSAKRL